MKTCYSSDEENYSLDSIDEAAEDIWNDGGHEVGDIVTVSEADAVTYNASRFVPDIADLMREQSYDVGGEHADTWDFTKEQEKSLQEAVEKAVDEWAARNNMHPTFYGVENARPVKVRFINEDGECEVVPENAAAQPTLTTTSTPE